MTHRLRKPTRAQRPAIQTISSPAVSAATRSTRPASRRRAIDRRPRDHRSTRYSSQRHRAFSSPLPPVVRVLHIQRSVRRYQPQSSRRSPTTREEAPIVKPTTPILAPSRSARDHLSWVADPSLNAATTINYYRRVQQATHTLSSTAACFFPIVAHCNASPASRGVARCDVYWSSTARPRSASSLKKRRASSA